MRWFYPILAWFIMGIIGCSTTKTNVVVPPASSESLKVRPEEHRARNESYSYSPKPPDSRIKPPDASPKPPESEVLNLGSLKGMLKPQDKSYALIVGIRNYKAINGPRFAENDARQFQRMLTNLAGFKDDQAHMRLRLNQVLPWVTFMEI